jgi:hypothetical protein
MTSLISQVGRGSSTLTSKEKKFTRMVKQAKLRLFNTAPRYKYGFEIPRTYEQAHSLDKRNGNTLWGDATVLELTQIDDYVTFIDKGTTPKSKHQRGIRKFESTSYMTSNTTVDIKPD